MNATEEFRGSVGSAMRYFTEHPEDRRKVKSFHKRVGKWYANTNEDKPHEFHESKKLKYNLL